MIKQLLPFILLSAACTMVNTMVNHQITLAERALEAGLIKRENLQFFNGRDLDGNDGALDDNDKFHINSEIALTYLIKLGEQGNHSAQALIIGYWTRRDIFSPPKELPTSVYRHC